MTRRAKLVLGIALGACALLAVAGVFAIVLWNIFGVALYGGSSIGWAPALVPLAAITSVGGGLLIGSALKKAG